MPSPQPHDAVTIASMFKKIKEGMKKYQEQQEQGPPQRRHVKATPKAGTPVREETTLFHSQLKFPSVVPSCEQPLGHGPIQVGSSARVANFPSLDLQGNCYDQLHLPQKPKFAPMTFDKPTFGESFCANIRDTQVDASKPGKRKGRDDDISADVTSTPTIKKTPYQNKFCSGFGPGFAYHQPTKEEVDDFVAFADKWIPSTKRRKTEEPKTEEGGLGGPKKSTEDEK